MRPRSAIALMLVLLLSSYLGAQAASTEAAPLQTARQALIEMLLGQSADHTEKHLPDITRKTLDGLKANGQNAPSIFSILSWESKFGKDKVKTFDTGSTFLITTEPIEGGYEKAEVTVERDDLNGDMDEIELVPHLFRGGKEENLPVLLSFIFSMKLEASIWRLNEVRLGVRVPLADPAYLKNLEEAQFRQNDQMAMWSMRNVVNAEKSYQAAQGSFACTLAELGAPGKDAGGRKHAYIYDQQLISGKKNGYSFTITDCDAAHYHVLAEPGAPGAGQRAFCADESGTLRASADGKAATCLTNGEVVEDKPVNSARAQLQGNRPSAGLDSAQRVRISQGVAQGLLVSRVPPEYPPTARQTRIQGTVLLKAVIS